ncbi:hypothetical protein [Rhodanobacter sp. C03]|uniref:hypothetical protein n=1 Tax=Rhodanobacter sp. C03 TaxID=1945858 RepID=UPI0009846A23|nr:hypothetical protein [Rhodanobacter sp. C03]OOG59397.1 hypothetical protein B0E48_00785 [Rhodanobacter sp. C03]
MTRFARSTALYSICLASLLLGACGKHPAAPPATPPATAAKAAAPTPTPATAHTAAAVSGTLVTSIATAPPASAASAPLSVANVTLGNAVNTAHQVTQPSNRFAPGDKTIYASVATAGRSGGATLNAKWSYLGGQGQLISSISQAIATDGPAVTTFMVQNPDLWPEGKYKVEISLDGKPVSTQDFEIARP